MRVTGFLLALNLTVPLFGGARPVPIILETDIGDDVDDMYALVLAARSPQVDLRAVVTLYGNVALRSALARKVLLLMGEDQVPVASGVAQPLDGQTPRNADWQGHGVIAAEEKVSGVSALPAVELMAQAVKASKGRTVIVAVGGLSNSAALLEKHPALRGKIARFVIMGGCVRPFVIEGKTYPEKWETNLHHDVKAATIVFNSGIPITLVPAEVTFKMKLYRTDFARIEQSSSPLAQVIARATLDFHAHIVKILGLDFAAGDSVALLHDPLAVSTLIDPSISTIQPTRIRLETAPAHIRTIEDPQGPIPIDLVTAADAPRLSRLVTDTVVGP
jgi:inosine-uridine nucleoside N-ribohydrolase